MKYFVLKPKGEDVFAIASRRAMREYARTIQRTDREFSLELRQWADKEWAQTEKGKRILEIGEPLNMWLDDSPDKVMLGGLQCAIAIAKLREFADEAESTIARTKSMGAERKNHLYQEINICRTAAQFLEDC